MDWRYLEYMDKNLLYEYAGSLADPTGRMSCAVIGEDGEQKKRSAFYLIWFVYRHVLGCRTLEETKAYQNEETLRRYRLNVLFKDCVLYVGDMDIVFHASSDIGIVLEILYGRYGLIKQIECCAAQSKGVKKTRCLGVLKKYMKTSERLREDGPLR